MVERLNKEKGKSPTTESRRGGEMVLKTKRRGKENWGPMGNLSTAAKSIHTRNRKKECKGGRVDWSQ